MTFATLTVGELRASLEGIADETPVRVEEANEGIAVELFGVYVDADGALVLYADQEYMLSHGPLEDYPDREWLAAVEPAP